MLNSRNMWFSVCVYPKQSSALPLTGFTNQRKETLRFKDIELEGSVTQMFVLQTGCKASAIVRLPASNRQILHSHLESQAVFTIPLLTVRRVHRKTLQGSLVPSPGYSKTSHAGNRRTKEGEKLKFGRGSGFPGSERRPIALAFRFPWTYRCAWRAFASLLLLELSHFPTALMYVYNGNFVFLHNISCTSSSTLCPCLILLLCISGKIVIKTLKNCDLGVMKLINWWKTFPYCK